MYNSSLDPHSHPVGVGTDAVNGHFTGKETEGREGARGNKLCRLTLSSLFFLKVCLLSGVRVSGFCFAVGDFWEAIA